MTVVVQLLGGLGNQLFQYSLGRALAVKHSTTLKLDTEAFQTYRLRTYALQHFNIAAEELSPTDRHALGLRGPSETRLGRVISRRLRWSSINSVVERTFEFDSSVLDVPVPCYLRGYWQSPKYFAAIDSTIRREVTVRDPLVGENLDAANRIGNSLSVSVHVRRGDYADSATTNWFHGTCSLDYYRAAESLLRQKLGEPRLFVFSDDPDWVEQNLRFDSPTTILRHNGPEQDYEDLRLMSLCQHHIIANSTFSWWGAWLCQNPRKIVVAPKRWFQGAGHSTADLIPAEWIRV